MARHLPPLASLRAFEAAARHLNFTRAADELHLTHGAISHQMKALEAQLGVTLFRRERRRVLLTDAGQRFAARVRAILGELAESVDAIVGKPDPRMLTVSLLPSFALRWLIPRLASFARRYPEVDLHVSASHAMAEFGADGVDIAVRFGRGGWPGVVAEKLFDEEVFPVASPKLVSKRWPLKPRELDRFPLLRSEREPWTPWFRAAGLALEEPKRGPIFSDEILMLQAAEAGLGIALARGAIAAPEIAAGRLVRLFPDRVPPRSAYYLVYPRANAALATVTAFREWIIGEVNPSTRKAR